MSNRRMFRNTMTLEKAPVSLYGKFSVGATGAPTLTAADSYGIKSIARTGVGAYTISFGLVGGAVDKYDRLMFAEASSIAALSTFARMTVVADNSRTSTPGITVQFLDGSGAAVEVGNGEVVLLKIDLSNTSV